MTEYQPFPTAMLPEPLSRITTVVSRSVGCDPAFVALPLLAACASAIGSTRRVVLKSGWSEPAIVWAAIVGESGTTKTPAFRLVVKPIRELQAKALRAHADAMRDYEAAMARYDRALAQWKRSKDDSDPPDLPREPQAARFVVSDTTVEALAPLLLANPRGVLLARDELAGWIGSFDRYASGGKGGADAAHWLAMHGGESLIVDRKTGPAKTLYVPQAYVSVCGGIQPGILHRAIGQEHRESGLLARLLLAYPPRRPKRWTDAGIDPAAEADLARLLVRLYDLQHGADDDGQPCPIYVGLDADAKREWVAFYDSHGAEQAELAGDMAAAWSKLEGYAARLALIIHYARWAAGDPSLRHPDRIDGDSVRRAVTLAEWCKTETRRVYDAMANAGRDRERDELVQWIRRKGGSVTARELQQGRRGYRTADDARQALGGLASEGLGEWAQIPATAEGGRPTVTFRLRGFVDSRHVDKSAHDGRPGGSVDSRHVDKSAHNGNGEQTLGYWDAVEV